MQPRVSSFTKVSPLSYLTDSSTVTEYNRKLNGLQASTKELTEQKKLVAECRLYNIHNIMVLNTNTNRSTHPAISTHTHTHTHTNTHTHTHARTHARTHTHTHTQVPDIYPDLLSGFLTPSPLPQTCLSLQMGNRTFAVKKRKISIQMRRTFPKLGLMHCFI